MPSNNQIGNQLEREAAQISKRHSGMIAFPTIGLALLIFCLYNLCLPVLGPLISTLKLDFLPPIPHYMRRYMGMGQIQNISG